MHTAQCTLHTAPATAPAPQPAPVHFILHIEHYTLHIIHLYYMLHTYHFTLYTFKIGLSGTQDLHGKKNLNLSCTGLKHSKSQRISRLHQSFKSFSKFAEWMDFAYWWSCIVEGVRAACEAGLFIKSNFPLIVCTVPQCQDSQSHRLSKVDTDDPLHQAGPLGLSEQPHGSWQTPEI